MPFSRCCVKTVNGLWSGVRQIALLSACRMEGDLAEGVWPGTELLGTQLAWGGREMKPQQGTG